MTSELEKKAEEVAREEGFYDCAKYYRGVMVGAKAVLDFARDNAKANWDTGEVLVNLAYLEKFVEGEK